LLNEDFHDLQERIYKSKPHIIDSYLAIYVSIFMFFSLSSIRAIGPELANIES